MEDIAKILRNVEFFDGIADEHLQRLAAISRTEEFPARYEIFHEYEPAKEVYVIIRGRISLVTCAPSVGCRQLMEVGSGELVGWSPLVGRSRLSDTAYTTTPTQVIAIDGEQLLRLCADDPPFGFQFMHHVAQMIASRLSATRLQLLEMSGVHFPEVQIESD